ncbi:MAG: AAA family ATPase [Clostridia bacterium]|nr:AAA family ATPase [Clostridia bacterium]MBR2433013.1 AAA family ATPase [Clostridia bacterium]
MTKVINIIGAPGVGKSTYAAKLFAEMKAQGFSCELVQEFAKEIVYADNNKLRNDQLIVMGEQYRRTFVLDGKVDYIITDSPILLSVIYNRLTPKPYAPQFFDKVCLEAFNKFDNINIMLSHNSARQYQQEGRVENLVQSIKIERAISDLIVRQGLKCLRNPSVDFVIDELKRVEKRKNEAHCAEIGWR